MKNTLTSICLFLLFFSFTGHAQIIYTIAGTGGFSGFMGDGGLATAARLYNPQATTTDINGNLYICDETNQRIRRVNSSGLISTFAGAVSGMGGFSGDGGPATAAGLSDPYGVAVDHVGNLLIADRYNNRIRKVDLMGVISTIAGTGVGMFSGDGGPATAATLYRPSGIATDNLGNLYICDMNNDRLRKIDAAGTMTTVAGTGLPGYTGDGAPATAAQFIYPACVACDKSGNIYVTDPSSYVVRKINAAGIISTFAGTGTGGFSGDGGPATAAKFQGPHGIAVDDCGNVYVGDIGNARVRKINSAGIMSTFAGTGTIGMGGDGGPATAATLNQPRGISVDGYGNVYISEYSLSIIRMVTSTNHMPVFMGGHSLGFVVCMNSSHNIDGLLSVFDIDTSQSIDWSPISSPAHGTLVAGFSGSTTGASTMPSGLTYTPTPGYYGPDSFKVKVKDCANGVDSAMVYVTVDACGLGVAGFNGLDNGLQVFPNPNSRSFTVALKSADNEPLHVIITDVVGKTIKELNMTTNKPEEITLDAAPGIYFIRASNGHNIYTSRLIKE